MSESSEQDGTGMYRQDGRRSKIRCNCGASGDDLEYAIDPVDDKLLVGCPDCREDIATADILFANVELRFQTDSLDKIDPELREPIKEEIDDA
jgi:hypothetical protein